ncbi:hypothetical protein C8R45DRAFT_901353 [Mycena sanguinolenta]|nr:hypothetical protein C8R45DRAFT_901353 [Mycena sanguinolenta]
MKGVGEHSQAASQRSSVFTQTRDGRQSTYVRSFLYFTLPSYFGRCPQCNSQDIQWDSWTGAGSRDVHGVRAEKKAIGYQLRCKPCQKKYGKGGSEVGAQGEDGEKLCYSFATTNTKFWAGWEHWNIPPFDLIIEPRPSTTSGKRLSENGKQVFIDFSNRTRVEECGRYLRTLTAICLNLDNTYKAASKATIVDESKTHMKLMKGGILSVLNELNEIISWRFCKSGGANEIMELLEERKFWRSKAVRLMSTLIFDQEHCIPMQCVQVIQGPGIIETLRAYYWTKGAVWSAAASSVHVVQLQHVNKGCLAQPRDDISSDRSRIEGSHKGWNGLQRAVASGLQLQTALGHDHVLSLNFRVAFNGKIKSENEFVLSTFGSHHAALVDHNLE